MKKMGKLWKLVWMKMKFNNHKIKINWICLWDRKIMAISITIIMTIMNNKIKKINKIKKDLKLLIMQII